MSNGSETTWDRDLAGPGTVTTWDRDYDGPGTRTIWDPLPAILGSIQKIIVSSPLWRVTVLSGRWRVRSG